MEANSIKHTCNGFGGTKATCAACIVRGNTKRSFRVYGYTPEAGSQTVFVQATNASAAKKLGAPLMPGFRFYTAWAHEPPKKAKAA